MRYELANVPWMGEAEPPFAIVTTDDAGTVVRIVPHEGASDKLLTVAHELIANFETDPSSFSLNRLAASYGYLKEIDDSVGGDGPLRLYIAFASTGFERDSRDPTDATPVAAVLAFSKEDPPVDAVSFSSSPLGGYIAGLFLEGLAGQEVASKYLGGFLTKDPNLLYFLLLRLPDTHPVFALVTKADGWQDYLSVREPGQRRRTARRG
jgi:hypothetical protein